MKLASRDITYPKLSYDLNNLRLLLSFFNTQFDHKSVCLKEIRKHEQLDGVYVGTVELVTGEEALRYWNCSILLKIHYGTPKFCPVGTSKWSPLSIQTLNGYLKTQR